MSTDKTLADVQPGGRVRLGDGDEKPPQELPKLIVTHGDGIPLPDQAAGIEEFKRQCLRRLGAEYPHLSAQPSPGGQGVVDDYESITAVTERLGSHAYVAEQSGERRVCKDIRALLADHSRLQALDARQPVAVPLASPGKGEWSDGWNACREATLRGEVHPVDDDDAAPPAQAVDLGALRKMLESWRNSDYPFSYEGQCAQRALDACVADLQGWLDNQAVGK